MTLHLQEQRLTGLILAPSAFILEQGTNTANRKSELLYRYSPNSVLNRSRTFHFDEVGDDTEVVL
jgi:hypothetical protein